MSWVGQLRYSYAKSRAALSSRLDTDECDSKSLAFYCFALFVSIIELLMTMRYVTAVANVPSVHLNHWLRIGLQIEYICFYIPTRVLLVYASLKRPIMRAFTRGNRILMSVIHVLYGLAPSEMISFFG